MIFTMEYTPDFNLSNSARNLHTHIKNHMTFVQVGSAYNNLSERHVVFIKFIDAVGL